MPTVILHFILLFFQAEPVISEDQTIHFRFNQMGYFPEERKVGVIFSKSPVDENFRVISKTGGQTRFEIKPRKVTNGNWGTFDYYYELDFTALKTNGEYYLQAEKSGQKSPEFRIASDAFSDHQETLLAFMRQQRCGYNPTLNVYCHQKDGMSYYGPMKDSTFVDVSGGWHDAGDQLKYLITSSYATAHMLMTYELYPDKFKDNFNALGQPGSNGIPDVLDEAKWGLDWIFKMHPEPDQLLHQVADDRDHKGFKMPDNDNSDYGWGANSYRAAYFANGQPQGLRKYKSMATGLANLAGRCAAAMAIASRIWEKDLKDPVFAAKCRKAALTLYALGRAKEGYQQGNSVLAPYRYNEDTWADDMEWGAAEIYKITRQTEYLDQAKTYALQSNTADSWTVRDTADHYRLYPFINMGHYVLHGLVDKKFKKKLEGYYLDGIKYTLRRGQANPFKIGVPFIWCSNNLATSLVAQMILYRKMSGDTQYDDFMLTQRDWLFGRNPWGTTMFSGIPEGGEFPREVHTSLYALKKLEIPGGLVDGPVYASIYKNLIGIRLDYPDEFAEFQNNFVTYHDDLGDYSTNEPTMDGTAGALLMMTHWGTKAK
ncbi:glycoside hydrolase family 9 [Emticicia sp. CRIBPO]|uniref:glycoside hydrolase family 9 protein n=1 Tax=Emticicia sp. CRIBPO TaxID=2683258 RepID=UPI0014126C73|nr:glycoside hydrolase family 9 protein [Emticicia sp. CRIBPO]NBA84693.1 glycoside hydrolase family 9 [Emticicia sp. CRIBPO]